MKQGKEGPPTFGVQPAAWAAWQQLQAALDTSDAQTIPCRGEHADWWTSDEAADRKQAAALCDGCPVADLCLDFAVLNLESWGVWCGFDFKHSRDRKAARTQREEKNPR